MVTGALVYQLLKQSDDKTLFQLLALFKQHPHYQSLWLFQIEKITQTQEEADQYQLMLAARI